MSTDEASSNLINSILHAFNDKLTVGGMFCDLTKAFDSVNHSILLSKLDYNGITDNALRLIKSYLDNRHQRALIKNAHFINYSSSWNKIKLGVPQGSILGPLLFLLYINDMPSYINSLYPSNNLYKITLFADDTSIIFTHPNHMEFENEFNNLFSNITRWFQVNSLSLNFNKTHFMHFQTSTNVKTHVNKDFKIKHINKVYSTNFLGLILDSTFSWGPHINNLASKLNSACYLIRCLQFLLPIETLRMVYFSNFHSLLSYGIIFWGNSSHSDTFFKLQKRSIRIIMRVGNNVSCWELFRRLNILPLCSQYILSLLLFVVKNINMFTLNSTVHSINTRYCFDLHLLAVHLTKFQKGIYYSGAKVFNFLPPSIKCLSSNIRRSKSTLKKFLLEGSFYTVQEYFDCSSSNNPKLEKSY
jgi:hypothetical protein